MDVVAAREASAEPVTIHDVTVTPWSRALVVRWPKGGFVWNRPTAVLVEQDGQARRIPIVDVTRILQVGLLGLAILRAGEQAPKMLEKIFAAAQPGAVFGQPVESGSYTLITASEVTSGGGFGVGMGRGPAPKRDAKQSPPAEAERPAGKQSIGGSGFGGGGGSMGRPVAIIAIGPSGVTVRPVVDVTKVVLAAVTASAAMLGLRRAMRRAAKGKS